MNYKEKISIVIPVYKVERYLDRCIKSVISQTYDNLEIILVDDGSPDKCPQICDKYSKIDNRIKVVHKDNGGLSDARNVGIKKSTGAWITFIDSDDFINKDYIEYLYNLALKNNSEISIVLPQEFYDEEKIKKQKRKEIINCYDYKEALIVMMYQKNFDTSAWGKLYKRELFNNVEFPYGKLYEDIATIYKVILKTQKVTYSNQKKYYYLKRNDSIMGQAFKEKDMDYIYQAEEMFNTIKKINDSELNKAAKCRFINANFSILLKMKRDKYDGNEKNIILDNIKRYRKEVFFDYKSRFKTKVALLLTLINFF